MFKKSGFFGIAVALAFCTQAFAQAPGCIVLKSVAEIEQVTINVKGEKVTKLVPAGKVVPGVEVTWTVTANNTCKQPSEMVTINNAVPEHMTYVANSAVGPGTDVSYSLDGKTFGSADQLTVQENGASRKARADEYKNIRWVFKDSLQPGAQGFARFRAVLN
jgi:uncharacterized repeat protein (TIGR01451 family)